jgi:hypothetical protein
MWLINATTLTLQEFVDDDIPPYNILSHTWAEEEVTFQDMMSGTEKGRAAYHKVMNMARLSLHPPTEYIGCNWVWIDTCCIDKSSSAGLSEAINSEDSHKIYLNRVDGQPQVCLATIETRWHALFIWQT